MSFQKNQLVRNVRKKEESFRNWTASHKGFFSLLDFLLPSDYTAQNGQTDVDEILEDKPQRRIGSPGEQFGQPRRSAVKQEKKNRRRLLIKVGQPSGEREIF